MAETFLHLSKRDRQDALGVAAARSGRPIHLLEKDVWVVWTLRTIFDSAFGPHLVFKGGTSLSKAYGAIRRFSEDVDVTYDIREIAPDLIGRDNEEALPPGYVKPVVLLEFGARSTGEPCEAINVRCDAAEYLPGLAFPVSSPRVMQAERTFWEKATAAHVYCLGGKIRGSRFARHWYDLVQLDTAGHTERAVARKELARRVARHKAMFFSEKAEGGESIDYSVAVSGKLQLIPQGPRLETLADDYRRMLEDGLLLDASPAFEEVIHRCWLLQDRVNIAMRNT